MDTSVYGALFEIVAPICLIILIGFWIAKTSDKIDTVGMSGFTMMVGTPALVFSTLTTTDIPTAVLLEVSLAAVCVCVLAIVIAVLFIKFAGLSIRTYLPSLTMPNSGSLGLPLVLLAFGENGLAFGIAFYFVIAVFQYSIMPIVVVGQFSVKSVLREPLIWAVAAALLVIFSGIKVPSVIADTSDILGGMMIPVMLVLLGASIAKLGFRDLKEALKLAVVRLLIGLASGGATIVLLGTSGVASGTIILMAVMPSAMVTYVFAARFNRNADTVAGLVVTSTVLTLICLPLLLLVAIRIAAV